MNMRRVVLLAALPVECKAALANISDPSETVHPTSGTIYYRGIFATGQGSLEVFVVQTGTGNVTAANIAQEAIHYLSPEMLFFVGIAGGLKDVKPGDVVAATKIYQYAAGRAGEEFSPQPEIGLATHRLIQRAMMVANNTQWLQRVEKSSLATFPDAYIGPIAAGEQVLTSNTSALRAFLQKYYSDALAIEMEGYGTLTATHINRINAIVIRGIANTLENKAELDRQYFQEIAARNASAFAFQMLADIAEKETVPALPESPQAAGIPQPAKRTGGKKKRNIIIFSIITLLLATLSLTGIFAFKSSQDNQNLRATARGTLELYCAAIQTHNLNDLRSLIPQPRQSEVLPASIKFSDCTPSSESGVPCSSAKQIFYASAGGHLRSLILQLIHGQWFIVYYSDSYPDTQINCSDDGSQPTVT
jgi:nucleoside phosphorylase